MAHIGGAHGSVHSSGARRHGPGPGPATRQIPRVPAKGDPAGQMPPGLSFSAGPCRFSFTGPPPEPPVAASTLQKNGSLYFTRPTLVTYTASTEDLRHSAGEVFKLFAQGVLKITINQRYALTDIAKAHSDLETGKTSGSSVIIP